MEIEKKRIDGWKSIAAFFNRDRTTVMRWAQSRDLPIYKVPGDGSTSVFAYAHELEAWLSKHGAIETETNPPAPTPAIETKPQVRTILFTPFVMAGLLGIIIVVALIATFSGSKNAKADLPPNRETANLYLQARADWASRSPEGLRASIKAFEEVTRQAPDFAPAYASLADAYLLAREFDSTPDAIAYQRAEAAARNALRLDKNSPHGNRAMAFISYWWWHDIDSARTYFNQAIEQDRDAVQTHFWYGNALIDNGQFAKGLRELEKALVKEPGSTAIQTDYAWALWSSGDRQQGKARLLQLAQKGKVSAYSYLTYIALADKDWTGYIDHIEKRSLLRNDANSVQQVAAQKRALQQGGEKALLDILSKNSVSDPSAPVSDSSGLAIYAALSNDRAKLYAILLKADQKNEIWGFSGMTQAVFKPWRQDTQINALINKRKGRDL